KRKDTVTPNEAHCLHGERGKGRKIDQSNAAQEQRRNQIVTWRRIVLSPEPPAQTMKGGTVSGNKSVSPLGDPRKAGQLTVKGEPKAFAAGMTQGQKTGLGRRGNFPIRRNVLNGILKCGDWDLGVLFSHFLIGRISHAVTRELPPIAHPIIAKA